MCRGELLPEGELAPTNAVTCCDRLMAGAGPGALGVLQADDRAHRLAHGVDRSGVRRPGATRSMAMGRKK